MSMQASDRHARAIVRSHIGGNADMGQGVQPLPPERHPPQRVREGRGEPNPVGTRQRTRRPQPPSGVWGARPRRRAQARLPAAGSGKAGVAREASQGRASSPAPQAKPHWARSAQGGEAPAAGSRACAAPPEHAARRALEAAGREGMPRRPGEASSLATRGAAALAAGPQARPGGWTCWRASTRRDQFAPSSP